MKKIVLTGLLLAGFYSVSLMKVDLVHGAESEEVTTSSVVETSQKRDEALQKLIEQGITDEEARWFKSVPDLSSVDTVSYTAFSMNDQQTKVVNEAKKYLGVPYLYGGSTPAGFDCSGLVQYVYKQSVGINLPRTTYEQDKVGKSVSMNSLLSGDLLFWIGDDGRTSHVAIYIGNGSYIHSPTPGTVVQVQTIKNWSPQFARRILPDTPAQKFKINDRVKIKKTATNWVGSSKLTDYDYTRVLLVEGYESNGVKLRIPGEWAGIIKESDLEKVTPAFKKGDYVKIKRTATKWVGSSNLSDNDYKRTHIVEGINSNGAITIRIPGSWAGNIREEDLEIDNTISDFKVGTNVSFGLDALKWIGGADIGYDNMMRSYKISKLNGDGTIYVRTLDDAWGGNVSINDLMLLRSNNIASNDVIKLRAAATNWVDGKPINIENKTTRSFIVKEKIINSIFIPMLPRDGQRGFMIGMLY